jgi:hypothetical protein
MISNHLTEMPLANPDDDPSGKGGYQSMPIPNSGNPFSRLFSRRGLMPVFLAALMSLTAVVGARTVGSHGAPTPEPVAGVALTAAGGVTRTMSFRDMGAFRPIELRGTDRSVYLPLTVRYDEAIVRARLHLAFTLSPSLIADLSQLRVLIDDEPVASIHLPREKLGIPQKLDLDLDPRFLVDFARLHFQFIGHYTTDCEFPFHTSLWASISNDSSLEMTTRPLMQANDLGAIPAPFFDKRDGRPLNLPVIFSAHPGPGAVRGAGVLASWFGTLSTYRGAYFPSLLNRLPDRHAVVLATNTDRPDVVNLPLVQKPTIQVVTHPHDPHAKLLLILGKDDDQLMTAVTALALGQAVLSGDHAEVQALKVPDPMVAYQSPFVIKTGERVRLGDLVDNPGALQTAGDYRDPVRVNLRLPADTFTWEARGMPINLRFRYTPPRDAGQANLIVRINDEFVDAFPLRAMSGTGNSSERMELPFLEDNGALVDQGFTVPAFKLGANNQLQFVFDIPPQDAGRCRATLSNVQAAIDPDSTLDLTHIEHYAAMPNLAFFANSGFPFTKYADLSQTAVVLPAHPSEPELSAYLGTLGMFGASTGMSGVRLEVVDEAHVGQAGDRDLLVVTGDAASPLLATWKSSLPAQIESEQRGAGALARFVAVGAEWFNGDKPHSYPTGGWVQWSAGGNLAALSGFESPLHNGRSVVVLSATHPQALASVTQALVDPGKVREVRGDLVLFKGTVIQSFRIGDSYYVGELTWWRWVWFQLHTHPVLLVFLGLILGGITALLVYQTLRRMAARRLSVRS